MTTTMRDLTTKLQADGYQITIPDDVKGYTFEATRGGEHLGIGRE